MFNLITEVIAVLCMLFATHRDRKKHEIKSQSEHVFQVTRSKRNTEDPNCDAKKEYDSSFCWKWKEKPV